MNVIVFIKKAYNFIKKKYLSYPTLSFLITQKNYFIKNLYVNFWIYISKKNKFFEKYFFIDNNFENKNYIFQLNSKIENLNQNCLEALSQNGILILENALDSQEQKKIIDIFEKIRINRNQNFRTSGSVERYFEYYDLNNFQFLKLVSNFFTKNIYGKELNSEAEFFIHKSLKIPEEIEHGDNNFHIDRFLPNMKILYSPFEITTNEAPFCYALGSHKINDQYLDFVKSSTKFNESEIEANQFLKKKTEITCKSNSIVIALTSGFHGRKSFLKQTDRKLIFLQFHKSFNKTSLIFG